MQDLHWLAEVEGIELLELRNTMLTSLVDIEVHTELREMDISHSAVSLRIFTRVLFPQVGHILSTYPR